jgi:hypothetical protein
MEFEQQGKARKATEGLLCTDCCMISISRRSSRRSRSDLPRFGIDLSATMSAVPRRRPLCTTPNEPVARPTTVESLQGSADLCMWVRASVGAWVRGCVGAWVGACVGERVTCGRRVRWSDGARETGQANGRMKCQSGDGRWRERAQ